MRVDSLSIETTACPTTAYVDRPAEDTSIAVILIHEWWGINQHIRDLARRYTQKKVTAASRPTCTAGASRKMPKKPLR